jgi:folate-dependent phosphoribosylglycinamide formyltransferase PurN
MVQHHIEAVSEKEQENIKQEIKEAEMQSYRERIEALTEKFKNDPTKLAVLSSIAQELASAE